MASIMGTQGFPKFDAFHAHCAMTYTFKETECLDAFNNMKLAIELWTPEPKAGGLYKIWDATEEENIWATRTTPTHHYVDDIQFVYTAPDAADFQKKGCTVSAKSRSQTLSYYDYNTNYCNMWNVFQ